MSDTAFLSKPDVELRVADGEIKIVGPYAMKDTFKHGLNCRWRKQEMAWITSATTGAAMECIRVLAPIATLKVNDAFKQLYAHAEQETSATVYKTMDELPEIPGRYCTCDGGPQPGNIDKGQNPLLCVQCELAIKSLNHQRRAYYFAINRDSAFFGMGMGTGKSKTTIATLDGRQLSRVLIACPKRVVAVWPSEFKRHSTREWMPIAPDMKMSVVKRAAFIQNNIRLAEARGVPYAVIINYDSMWRAPMDSLLREIGFEAFVADESHRLKSPGGKASKYVHRLVEGNKANARIKHRYLCTGTPMPHSPLDIFAQMRILDPGVFGTNFHRFRSKYAIMGGYEGRQVIDYQNVDELNEKWGRYAFICGDEVLDLPPQRHLGKEQGFSTTLEPKAMKLYKELDRDFVAMTDEQDIIVGDNALTKLLRLQQLTSGWVKNDEGTLIQVSTAKQELLRETMEDFSETEPLVVCCRFRHDLDTVKGIAESQGRRYSEISGRVSEHHPEYGLDGPRMRSDTDVLAVQIQAGGVGIDLTRAAYCILFSVGYSLGDYLQFLKRTHRPGQVRPVQYIHLVVEGTKDEDVYDALMKREELVGFMIKKAREH